MFRAMHLAVLLLAVVLCVYAAPATLEGMPEPSTSVVLKDSTPRAEGEGAKDDKDLKTDATSYLGYTSHAARFPYGYNYNGYDWAGYSRIYPSHFRTSYWSPYNAWHY